MRRPAAALVCAVAVSAACQGGTDRAAKPGPGPGTAVTPVRLSGNAIAVADLPDRPAPAAPPLGLTTSDGTGLTLTRLDARAVVDGPLAFTELRLTFANPEDRVLEGRFAITLPERAAISRFAMKIDDRWMEAEVVERQAARRAYEDFLHRRQDPALLEKEAGNEFRARVFPIPARGEKELIVAYSQELADPDAPFVLPLQGLPAVGQLDARIQVARVDSGALVWDEATLSERDWKPDRDLAVPGSGATHALGAPGVVALRVAPELPPAPEVITRATILVDTSASRALGFAAYARAVDELVAALGRAHAGLEVRVAAFDQDVAAVYEGAAAAAAGKLEAALVERGALGASRLDAALAWAKARGAAGRVVVITDGVATAGQLDATALGEAAAGLGAGVERLDVVLAGGIRERAAAEAMTRGRLARDGAVLDLDDGAGEVARRLGLATRSGIAVAVEGARWTWPDRIDGVQPGDAAMIYAAVDGAPSRVTVTLGADRRQLTVEPAVAPLVERAAVAAEIARMEASLGAITDAKARAAAVDEIVKRSTTYRVLSDHTAMLVLETEADYQRFGIERTALAGILVVGDQGVEVRSRKDVAWLAVDVTTTKQEPRKAEKKKDVAAAREASVREEVATGAEAPADDGEPGADGYVADPAPLADHAPGAPPPPPAPITEEESDDESGGTGTAMALDEGRMGRRDSDRAEGQYRMRNQAEPAERRPAPRPPSDDAPANDGPASYTGRMATVMELIAKGKAGAALVEATTWRATDPADVLALIALGEAYEATREVGSAARAYGSLIDLFPARADLRRFAGERLDRLAGAEGDAAAAARALAVDTYERAVAQRPDHLTGHRLLAYALVRAGRPADAFAAVEAGLAQRYPDGRFREGERILREDLGLIGAAWLAAEPKARGEIIERLAAARASLSRTPSTRFVLVWETDGNDVDFHIRDARGGHAYYQAMKLASGGELYADVTTGYGPECFTIEGKPAAAPYALSIHYYSRGPMGYGMGKLQVLRHDGKGGLTFEDRPFVVMNDRAFVELGEVK